MQNVSRRFFSPGLLGILCISFLIFQSCTYRGAATPKQAFDAVKTAFEREDAVSLAANLSSGSLNKIDAIRSQFAAMPDGQLTAAAELYGMTAAELKGLSRESFIRLIIIYDKKVLFYGNSEPAGIDINKSAGTASVLMVNGNELSFVKEGPYWRLEITDL